MKQIHHHDKSFFKLATNLIQAYSNSTETTKNDFTKGRKNGSKFT